MKAYHICHHIDEDGLASAAIIYEYLKIVNKGNKKNIRYHFHKIDYTMDLKTILPYTIPAGDEIYFVDYSFSNQNNLDYVLSLCNNNDVKITWIDHHKSSIEVSDENFNNLSSNTNFEYFINTRFCGAYLAYVYAYSKLNDIGYIVKADGEYDLAIVPDYVPWYIRYVDSWDTWKHNMPNTTEFNIGIKLERRTPKNVFGSMFDYKAEIINKLFSESPEDNNLIDAHMKKYINDIIHKGKIIKYYEDINNEALCNELGFEFTINDCSCGYGKIYKCFAINKRGNSTMFGDRVKNYDIVVPFQFNGTQYVYSLYTCDNFIDCSILAKKLGTVDGLGGGGHAQAAGFQTYKQLIKKDCTVCISKKLFGKEKYSITSK